MSIVFKNTNGSTNNAAEGQNGERWKATAFLNLWARRKDGSRFKIGAIALKDSKRTDAGLIERLKQEGGVEALLAAMEVDFQLADQQGPVDVGF